MFARSVSSSKRSALAVLRRPLHSFPAHQVNTRVESALSGLAQLGAKGEGDGSAKDSNAEACFFIPPSQALDMSALHTRPTFQLLRNQLLKASVGDADWKSQESSRVTKALNSGAHTKKVPALLGVATCYIDGFGHFPRDRAKAKGLLGKLHELLPSSPWPAFYQAIILLLDAQDRLPLNSKLYPAGVDLSRAPPAARSSADCTAAASLLADIWAQFQAPAAPLMLARCHYYGVGTAASTEAALRWLVTGARAGDPVCCAEIARFMLTRSSSSSHPDGAAAVESSGSAAAALVEEGPVSAAAGDTLMTCLRYAALCGVPYALQTLVQQYEAAGQPAAAAAWRDVPLLPALGEIAAARSGVTATLGLGARDAAGLAAASTAAATPQVLHTSKPRPAKEKTTQKK